MHIQPVHCSRYLSTRTAVEACTVERNLESRLQLLVQCTHVIGPTRRHVYRTTGIRIQGSTRTAAQYILASYSVDLHVSRM